MPMSSAPVVRRSSIFSSVPQSAVPTANCPTVGRRAGSFLRGPPSSCAIPPSGGDRRAPGRSDVAAASLESRKCPGATHRGGRHAASRHASSSGRVPVERHTPLGGRDEVDLPTGDSLTWSGQYKYVERANKRLQVLVPIALAIIFLLLFLHLKSAYKSALLLGLLPLCTVGATWLMVVLPGAYMLIQRYCYRRQLRGNERERAETTGEARGASLP